MTTQYNILDAKTRLSELVRRAAAGEEIIIANRGEPLARLVPVKPVEAHPVGSASGILAVVSQFTGTGRAAEEIDAEIETERNAWD